jgi:CRP-like cAMP-binding protein
MNRIHPAHSKLEGHPLLREFEPEELDNLLELSEPRLFAAGREIFHQGDEGRSMFLLVEGEARAVLHHSDGSEIEVARYGVGDIFGELTLLDNQPRNADAIATTDCMVMAITTGLLRMLGHSSPRAAFKLAMAVLELAGRRLRDSNQRYVDSLDIVSALAAGSTVMSEQQVA